MKRPSPQIEIFSLAELDASVPFSTLAERALGHLRRGTAPDANAFFNQIPRIRSAASDSQFDDFIRRALRIAAAGHTNALPYIALSIKDWGPVASGALRDVCMTLAQNRGARQCAMHSDQHWLNGDAEFVRSIWAQAKTEATKGVPLSPCNFAFILANNARVSALVPEVVEELASSGDKDCVRFAVEAARRILRDCHETTMRQRMVPIAGIQAPEPEMPDNDDLDDGPADGACSTHHRTHPRR